MREVDAADFVSRLMVVRMQAEAGNSVGNDALPGETVVVGSLEEILFGVRVGDQVGSMARQLGPQVAATGNR